LEKTKEGILCISKKPLAHIGEQGFDQAKKVFCMLQFVSYLKKNEANLQFLLSKNIRRSGDFDF
jgi:hypothetical protein